MSTETSLLAQSSLLGIARGVITHTLIHPLQVIKNRQQYSPHAEKCTQIARDLFREGPKSFFRGLTPELVKTSLKQAWVWPMIVGFPPDKYNLGKVERQTLKGLSIAAIDAALTPLDGAKIRSALTGKNKFSWAELHENGWRGWRANLTNRSVQWVTFLVAQQELRDRKQSEKPLSLPQLSAIGVQVALIVSVLSAPFDTKNTRKQAENQSPKQPLARTTLRTSYRGWPVSAISLVIQNIASI
ncbi:MAG TPA: MC/SLC25 family protein, partial [Chlamydiales bacterium]|nr:MC/SLC25 family protein [Chlamydiales bacterium]